MPDDFPNQRGDDAISDGAKPVDNAPVAPQAPDGEQGGLNFGEVSPGSEGDGSSGPPPGSPAGGAAGSGSAPDAGAPEGDAGP
jgi:hypothetical protein